MEFRQIRATIESAFQEPVLHVCLSIVDRLAVMKPAQTKRLTYVLLARMAHCDAQDDAFQAAVTGLTSMQHRPLTMYFVMDDFEDEREISISASEVFRSVDEQLFIHPRTGDVVPDFADRLKPVFRASDEFLDAVARHG